MNIGLYNMVQEPEVERFLYCASACRGRHNPDTDKYLHFKLIVQGWIGIIAEKIKEKQHLAVLSNCSVPMLMNGQSKTRD